MKSNVEKDPYFVEVDKDGCAMCGHGRTYLVVGPDGMALSVSYGDYDDAQHQADDCSRAYRLGLKHRKEENRR